MRGFILLIAFILPLQAYLPNPNPSLAPPENRVHPEILKAAGKAFVAAYPDHLLKYKNNILLWRDSTQMRLDPHITSGHFHALMKAGRINLESVFKKMYGENKKEAYANLKTVNWLPKSRGQKITFSSENGAAEALQKVSLALDTLPALRKYLTPISGTYVWRKISGSEKLSCHSFGIAIDINSKYGDYWRWAPEFKAGKDPVLRNRIPMEIVEIFEAHGFVWGGRWPHYDTMHFEYRPEVKLYNDWFATSRFNHNK